MSPNALAPFFINAAWSAALGLPPDNAAVVVPINTSVKIARCVLSSLVPWGSNELIASVTIPEEAIRLFIIAALGFGLFVSCAVIAALITFCAVRGNFANLPPVFAFIFPSIASVPAPIPPDTNALTGSWPVTIATDAPAAALPIICPATALPVTLAAAGLTLPPTYEPTSCATYALAVVSSTSPISPPFAATSAPSISGSAHALPVETAAICAMVLTGLSSAD